MGAHSAHATTQQGEHEKSNSSTERFSLDAINSMDDHEPQELSTIRSWLQRIRSKRKAHENSKKTSTSHRETKTDKTEQTKILISKSKTRWLGGLLIHIIPALTASVIAVITLQGYFIGTQFAGVTDSHSQPFILFALQMTAKLFEIIVVASLGFMILECVQHLLFFDDSGLPLGLAGAYLMFTNLFYLGSPSFWSGIGGLNTNKSRIGIAFLLVSCGLLANFIGPSTAVLLIPTYTNQWPAGGLRYRFPQDSATMWPLELNQSHVGGPGCLNPSENVWSDQNLSLTGCIWYGSIAISSVVREQLSFKANLTMVDTEWLGPTDRYISWCTYGLSEIVDDTSTLTSWVWSTMSIANAITSTLLMDWAWVVDRVTDFDYINGTNLTSINNGLWGTFSRYARYPYRDPFGTQAELQGLLGPMARGSCIVSQPQIFNATNVLSYPVAPLLANYALDTNATWSVKTDLAPETSSIRATWIDKSAILKNSPGGGMNSRESFLEGGDDVPSALLAIQIPLTSAAFGLVYTCSIDARWTDVATNFDFFNDRQLFSLNGPPPVFARLMDGVIDAAGRPMVGQTSPQVNLDLAWLNQLTPSMNNTNSSVDTNIASSGYNSLSKILGAIPQDKYINSGREYGLFIGRLVAMLVVDGMARHSLNDLLDGSLGDILNQWLSESASGDPRKLLAGGGGTDLLAPDTSSPPRVELLWSVTISGYAYSVTDSASRLALAVLFAYITFAMKHIIFSFTKRWSSNAWRWVPEIVALCQNSPGSDLLRNTGGGIKTSLTRRLVLKLRVAETIDGVERDQTVHVLINKRRRRLGYRRSVSYRKVEKEKRYS